MNDPRSREPRTAAGRRLLNQCLDYERLEGWPAVDDPLAAILAIEAEASSSDELRAALTPDEWQHVAQLVEAFGPSESDMHDRLLAVLHASRLDADKEGEAR